jgi:hypothetical protein
MGFVKKVQIVASGAALYMAHPSQYDHGSAYALSLKACISGTKTMTTPAFGAKLQEYKRVTLDHDTAIRLGYEGKDRNKVQVPEILVKVYEALIENGNKRAAEIGIGGRVNDGNVTYPDTEAELITDIQAGVYTGCQLTKMVTSKWLNQLKNEDKLLDLAFFDLKNPTTLTMAHFENALPSRSNKVLKIAVLRYLFMISDMILEVQRASTIPHAEQSTVRGLTQLIAINGFRSVELSNPLISIRTGVSGLWFETGVKLNKSDLKGGPNNSAQKQRLYKIVTDTYESIQGDLPNASKLPGMNVSLPMARTGNFPMVIMSIGTYLDTMQNQVIFNLFLDVYTHWSECHNAEQVRSHLSATVRQENTRLVDSGESRTLVSPGAVLEDCLKQSAWHDAYIKFIESTDPDAHQAPKDILSYLVAMSDDQPVHKIVEKFATNDHVTALVEGEKITNGTLLRYETAARVNLLNRSNKHGIQAFIESEQYNAEKVRSDAELQEAKLLKAASTDVSVRTRRSSPAAGAAQLLSRLSSGLMMQGFRRSPSTSSLRPASRSAVTADLSFGRSYNFKKTGASLSVTASKASSLDTIPDGAHRISGGLPVEGLNNGKVTLDAVVKDNDTAAAPAAEVLAQATVLPLSQAEPLTEISSVTTELSEDPSNRVPAA